MRNLRRTATILSSILAVTSGAALVVVGCGGDDTIIGTGGPDSGGDVSSDVTTDTGIGDSGGDAFHFDAGPPDLSNFYHQINETGCAWIQNCCGGASKFDLNACVAGFDDPTTFGFLFTRTLNTVPDGGNVTFDGEKASQCLSLIQGLSCGTANTSVTSAEVIAIRDACYGAIQGTIPAGSTGCTADIECVPPAHCDPAGGGTCVAPLAQGATCVLPSDTNPTQSLGRCGRAYSGTPRYCEVGPFISLPEAGTCDSPHGTGTGCYAPYECSSWICDNTTDPGQCAASEALINSDLCAAFPPADAGDGG